jgi:hypothetical protein
MDMMKRVFASRIAVLALASAGCASLPAIQQSSPILTLGAPGSPERTSACIVSEVTQAGPDVSILRPPWDPPTAQKVGDDYQIVLVSAGGGSALAEVVVKPQGSGSRVEVRVKPWDTQDAFLDAVQKCAKPG